MLCYISKTERNVRATTHEHVDAMTFTVKKSTLSRHAMDFNHRINRDNVKMVKTRSHAYRRRVAENILIEELVH